ncbi:MAG: hypothetical protein ACFFE8_01845 [Candidatus Heimdallarchaeota archaeon]
MTIHPFVHGQPVDVYNATCTIINLICGFTGCTVLIQFLNESPGNQPPNGPFLPENLQLILIQADLGIGLAGTLFVLMNFILRL